MPEEIADVQEQTASNIIEVKNSNSTPATRSLMVDSPEKTKESTRSLLDQTKEAAKELKTLIEQNNKVLEKMEDFRAQEILKGRSEAGVIIKQITETPSEYAQRILRGNLK